MAVVYLDDHKEFPELLRIIEDETGILAGLVEKDYWIMHALYGLKKQGYEFKTSFILFAMSEPLQYGRRPTLET